jgi:O-antigen/teichoic acid export membrane protein
MCGILTMRAWGRRRPRAPGQLAEISAEVFSARLVLAAIAAAIMGVAALVAIPDPAARTLTLLYGAALLGLPAAQAWLFQATGRIGTTAIVQNVRMGAFALGVAIFVTSADRTVWVGWFELGSVVVAGAWALRQQRRWITPIRFAWDPARLWGLVRESAPVGLSHVVWAVNQYLPSLLVATLLGLAAAAPFSAAHRVFVSLVTFAWIYHFNLFPILARLTKESPVALREMVTDSVRFCSWAGILGAVLVTLLATPILTLLFGAEFASAGLAFAVMVWTVPILLLSDHPRWVLVAAGWERTVVLIQAVGVVITLAAGALLIRRFGVVGGAASIVLANLVRRPALPIARQPWMPIRRSCRRRSPGVPSAMLESPITRRRCTARVHHRRRRTEPEFPRASSARLGKGLTAPARLLNFPRHHR